ncbi:hypothetical protein SKAU_G00139810 [Synaphobranchus kaupii]|uniref:Uncharacterized protein n=1 Tax=Synaphobranchus kaupii TaxID=118154 RepID=A0A9Q1J4B2_SYNKA|nr:hypothetical protein SKAU_G00139810 [Synaphobranchus kaupii]
MNRPDKDLADFLSPLHPAFGRYAARQSRYELACQDALEKHLSQCLAGLLIGSARATAGLLSGSARSVADLLNVPALILRCCFS